MKFGHAAHVPDADRGMRRAHIALHLVISLAQRSIIERAFKGNVQHARAHGEFESDRHLREGELYAPPQRAAARRQVAISPTERLSRTKQAASTRTRLAGLGLLI